MKAIILMVMALAPSFAGAQIWSRGPSSNLTLSGMDTRYVNSPTESTAQTFTNSLTLSGSSLTVSGAQGFAGVNISSGLYVGGKVGVGITAPTYLNETFNGSAGYARFGGTGQTTGALGYFIRNQSSANTDSSVFRVLQNAATDDQAAAEIDQVGTGDILQLKDNSTSVVTVKDGGNTTFASTVTITGADATSHYGLLVSSNVSLAGVLNTMAGKVGINDASPTATLTVGFSNTTTSGGITAGISANNTSGTAGDTAGISFCTSLDTNCKQYIGGIRSATGSGVGRIAFMASPTADANPVTFADERMSILEGGNVGIGTTGPVDGKLVLSSGAFVTDGIAANRKAWQEGDSRGVYALNKSGAALSSGTVVQQFADASFSVAVTTAIADSESPIGTAYDATCANGAYCRICTEGICPARLESGSACAATNDLVQVGDENGRAECAVISAGVAHNQEIGNPASYSASNGDVVLIWAHRN